MLTKAIENTYILNSKKKAMGMAAVHKDRGLCSAFHFSLLAYVSFTLENRVVRIFQHLKKNGYEVPKYPGI